MYSLYALYRHGAEVVDPHKLPSPAGPSTSSFGGRGYRLGHTPDDIEGTFLSTFSSIMRVL